MFNLPIPPLPFPGIGLNTAVSIPVGTVVAFAGKIAPRPSITPSEYTTPIESFGWIVCDGTPLLVSEYPELFAVLGYLYGGQNGEFNLPDYRGLFLRGVDSGANNDPDISSRKAAAGGTQDGVGATQDDALQTHQHEYNEVPTTPTLIPGDKGSSTIAAPPTTGLTGTPTNSIVQNTVRTSEKETRPKNIAVHYIIKFTNGC